MNTREKYSNFFCGLLIAAATVLAFLLPQSVSAAPAANSVISNQAVASYVDGSGTLRTVNSNLVQSTVAQIGAFELTGANTKVAILGSMVYMQHTLINRGNGPDSFTVKVEEPTSPGVFSKIAVYSDADGTGLPSDTTALCGTAVTERCNVEGFSRLLAGNGGEFRFLVVYTAPRHTVQPGPNQFTARVFAEPTDKSSRFYATYAPAVREQTDTVEIITGATFSLTKAIAAPIQKPAVGQWPEALFSAKAGVAGCSTQWSATLLASNPSCAYTVYTLSYANTGSLEGDLTLRETLPVGLTYVQGSAVWSGDEGAALLEDAHASAQGSGESKIHFSYTKATAVLDATVLGVGSNTSGTLSFVVLVNHAARPGTETTTSLAHYYSSTCNPLLARSNQAQCGGVGMSTNPQPPVETNSVPFYVDQTYGVVAAGVASITHDGAQGPFKEGDNLVEHAQITAGEFALFRNVITNTGDGLDAFNIIANSAEGSTRFPANTEFHILRADGFTRLADTNNDGVPDTGPVAPGASVTIVVRAKLPFLAKIESAPLEALVTASSVGNGTAVNPRAQDSVWNRVNTVVGSSADLTATPAGNILKTHDEDGGEVISVCTSGVNCDVGQGPSAAPTLTQVAHQGVGVVFNLFLRNNDTIDQTYSLSAELPLGWTVKFLAGANAKCDGDALVPPLEVAVGAQVALSACITPSAGAPFGSTLFRLTARSTLPSSNRNIVSDTVTYAARVTQPLVREMTVIPVSESTAVTIGGFVVQSIALKNTGGKSCAAEPSSALTAVATLESGAQAQGWQTSLYYDKNSDGVLDAGDVLLSPDSSGVDGNSPHDVVKIDSSIRPFVPGRVIKLLLKTQASAGVPLQSRATVTLVIADVGGDSGVACPSQTAKYTFVAQNDNVRILKTQALDAACSGNADLLSNLSVDSVSVPPGQCLIYQVTLNNDGASHLFDVTVSSGVPVYTSYTTPVEGQPSGQCESHGVSGVPVAYSTSTENSKVQTAFCGSASNSLAPSGFVKLTYSVKVDQ